MEKAGGPEAEPLHIPAGWDLGEEENQSPSVILQQNNWYNRALSMEAASLLYKCWVGKMNSTVR